MIEWLDDFYGSDTTRAAISASIAPVFEKYAAEVWKADGGPGKPPADFVESLSDTYVKHHLDSSRAQLQEVLKADDPKAAIQGRITEWIEKRPAKVAANETVRTANAIALEAMRAMGAKEKVWVTSGTCAFCKKMAGKRAALNEPFISAGDEVNPEGQEPMPVRSNVGHPPLHRGCQCSIAPEGFQQTLGLFPEAERPLMSDAQRYRYVDPKLRPTDPELAEAWDRAVDIDRAVRDGIIDRDSAWTGIVKRTEAGDWGDSANWDGSISFDLNMVRTPSERFHVMLHESLHHYGGDALNQQAFLGYRGWEEGLVEQLTRIYRQEVAGALGIRLDATALRTWEKATNYNRYITQLEKVRKGLGSAPRGFYEALHVLPTNERINFVRSVARDKVANGEWTASQLSAFLKTVDDAHLVLQV